MFYVGLDSRGGAPIVQGAAGAMGGGDHSGGIIAGKRGGGQWGRGVTLEQAANLQRTAAPPVKSSDCRCDKIL